jgi:exodeoxyribonuclease VII large subunit
MGQPAPRTKPLRVSELAELIKRRLEDGIPYVCVEGEVSNYKGPHSTSGHVYFSLKDEGAVIDCVMWRSFAQRLAFRLENGLAVIACGTVSFYEKQGRTQLYVQRIEPAGIGALQLAFEQLVAKLRAEGLFDEARKKPLPLVPRLVGIVTSPDGAARRDIETTIQKRFPGMAMELFPVPVQGGAAAPEIAAMIRRINATRDDVDVLIVGRGGGSIEDLWAFNTEIVARAIAESRIPIISGVGHETDTVIADLVADVRAKTPTDAAVRAVPDRAEIEARLARLAGALDNRMDERLLRARDLLNACAGRYGLRRVVDAVAELRARLDGHARRLREGVRAPVDRMSTAAREYAVRLAPEAGMRRLDALRTEIGHAARRIRDAGGRAVERRGEALKALAGRLDALSPLRVLERGYSITYASDGHVVTDAAQLRPGARIRTRFRRGEATSRIEDIERGA